MKHFIEIGQSVYAVDTIDRIDYDPEGDPETVHVLHTNGDHPSESFNSAAEASACYEVVKEILHQHGLLLRRPLLPTR